MPTKAEVAAGFGYSLAFFDSDPELRRLLNRAVDAKAGTYTQERFIAEFQNTKWFRRHGEAYRKYIALQKTDPKTLAQMQATAYANILQMAREMGATGLSGAQIKQLANQSLMFGYDETQQRNALLSHVKVNSKTGLYQGSAGQAATRYKQLADDYGVKISDATLGNFVRGSLRGDINEAYVQQWAAAQAASRYPALAQQLRAGQSLRELADPYVQSYAKILEVNPETIKLDDKQIQQALAGKDAKGAPSVKTVWQFEQDLRNDDRWLKTNNARDELVGNTRKVLQDFGLVV